MGNEQQTEGKWDQAKGNVKEAVGDATNNERMEREGQYDQAKGHVKEGIGDVREGIDRAANDAGNAADDYNRDR